MVNTNMFHHPKYYKELRSIRNKLDQAISEEAVLPSVRTGPGLKQQSASLKRKASEDTSAKQQAPSDKPQASSRKRQAS